MGGLRILAVCTVALLAACSENEEILQGERLTLDGDTVVASGGAGLSVPVALSAPLANATWGQAEGNALKSPGHVQLSAAPSLVWSTNAVEPITRRNSVAATPVVSQGRVFALGAASDVTALSTGGAVLWKASVSPRSDSGRDASGGGITVADGRVFVSTGYGYLVALDATTGAELWRQDTEAAGLSPATVADGILYVTARTGTAFAIDPKNGKVLWSVAGPQSQATTMISASPTITSKWALFPFATGEILSTFRKGGLRNWTSVVSGGRNGTAISSVNDISSGPVVVGSNVIVGNTAGRLVALGLGQGDRIWTTDEGVTSHMVTVGTNVFFVNDRNELLRVSAGDGGVLWRNALPRFTRDRADKRDAIFAHFGPVLAGGRLWIASTDGSLRSFDLESGRLISTIALPAAASASPSVANGTLYVPTKNGSVHAYR